MHNKKWILGALALTLAAGASACGPDETGTGQGGNNPIILDMGGSNNSSMDMMTPGDMNTPEDMAQPEDMPSPEDMNMPEDMGMPEDMNMPPVDMAPTPCSKDGDCADPQICVVDATTGDATCQDPTGTKTTGDACADGSECRSGLCFNGACAAPCTTGADCPNGFDCETSTVPLEGGGSAELSVCVEADKNCLSNEACDAPEVCVVDRTGNMAVLTCQDPVPGGEDLGGMCSADADCLSGLCLDGLCARPCERPNDCSTDGSFICEPATVTTGGGDVTLNVCKPRPPQQCLTDSNCANPDRCVATRSATEVEFACGAPNNGGGEGCADCTQDSDCAQNLCLDGKCANPCQQNGDCTATDYTCELVEVDLGNNATDTAQVCTPPVSCVEKGECKVTEECYVRRTNQGVEQICRPGNAGGGQLGQVCSQDSSCAANLCYSGRFGQVCSTPCNDDQDCPTAGYACLTVDVQAANGTTTSAQICAPEPPPACTSNDDCQTGTTCAIVANAAGTSLESVCIPSTGKLATGVACAADSDCESRVCFNNTCAAPCDSTNQCGVSQACVQNTVTKSGLSGGFDICERLGDQQCTSTGACTDGVRVCGDLRQDAQGDVAAFCRFPNSNGAQLGTSCMANSECREGLCLGTSNECSVACTQDTDCSAANNQVCTTFSFSQNSDVNLCVRGCTDNASCTGGNVCTVSQDVTDNDVDQICRTPIGQSQLGASCTNGGECAEGLCLTTNVYDGVSCTSDAQCSGTKTCECPIDDPNCTNGKQCADVSQRCSRLCDDNSDCTGGVAGNALTACNGDVFVSRPNGGTKLLSLCGQP